MKFHPLLTRNRKIKSLFPAKSHDCEIRDAQGKVVFSMKGVRAPQNWSPLAIEIVASKYLRKTGVGKEGSEKSIYQMIERVVGAIVKQGKKQKYFSSARAAKNFEQELTYILLDQRAFLNSPVWFNCGLYEAYGIRSAATQWAWDEKKKKPLKIMDAYQRPQVSACFIQSIEDSLDGIFELAKNEAMLFKYGSGSGTNFSTLRSKYENIESGGTSSGLMSFLEVLDKGAGAVKSGGITRRAAKMVILDIDHPEIGEFIDWKAKEEKTAFKHFSKNKIAMKKVIALHAKANENLKLSQIPSELQEIADEIWDEVKKTASQKGFRNAQVTVMAPTGTIGLAMDSDTTGIEPEFSLIKNKKMAGGLNLKIYSHALMPALQNLGFSEEKIRNIFDYLELRGTLSDCPLLTKEQRRIFACAIDIQSKDHLQMMAAIQPLISGAISKTVNLPAEASQEEVSEIYLQAWKLGLKSITIYRENSKGAQPLNRSEPILPKCPDCGAPTELAGGCFRCINCGAVIGCA